MKATKNTNVNSIKKTNKQIVSAIPETKIKKKRTLLEKEALKNAIFEELAFGSTLEETATKFGYSRTHIANLSKEIDDDFVLEITSTDRNLKIAKQIRRLEAITKTLYKELQVSDNVRDKVSLQSQILKTMEYVAKLQGLLITVVETNDKTDKADAFLGMFQVFTENTDNEKKTT